MIRHNHPFLSAFVCVFILVGAASTQAADSSGIGFEWGDERFDVIIRGNGSPTCTSKYVENPPRIELQCENTLNRTEQTLEAPENPYVHRVRMSPTGKGEKGSKMTVELKWKFAYALEATGDRLIVRLFSRSAQRLVNPDPPSATPMQTTTTKTQPSASTIQPANRTQTPPKTLPKSTASAAADSPVDLTKEDLVIGPDDLLEINVFQLPEFSITARVSGDGTVTMPLVGSVEVSGLSRKEAEQTIAKSLADNHVNNPAVSITIKEYRSRQVSVLGAVNHEGIQYLTSPRTLLQLISEAGGLKDDVGYKCYIFRGGSKIEIDLHDLIHNGNQSLNVGIKPGDVVNIPPRPKGFAYVLGAVRSPGAIEITPTEGLTLAAAIARSGGPSRLASLSNIQIRRKDEGGKEQVIKANLKDILKGKAPDIPLLPDDLINVPESFF